ncbi:MAG: hypothetical protein Q4D29_12545 [Lachnospiraceae bacterium]|nr:hypothetical protein [Lachnospiraceae bacterium]
MFEKNIIFATEPPQYTKMSTIKYIIIILIGLLDFTAQAQVSNDSIKSISLDEVLVTAENIYRNGDHIVVLPTTNQKKHSSTGYALLDNLMIPGLTISKDGSVSTMGIFTSLYINGQPAGVQDITYLQPKDVAKIEIYDSPKGKYAKDNIALNFVIKQYHYGGYLQLSADQSIGVDNGNYRAVTSFSKGSLTYYLFGGYNYTNLNNIRTSSFEEYYLPNNCAERKTSTSQNIRGRNEYVQVQVQYRRPKQYLIGKFSFVESSIPHNNSKGQTITNGSVESTYTTSISNKTLSPKLDFNGEFSLSKTQTISFGLHGIYYRNDYNRLYAERTTEYITNSAEDVWNFNAGLIYTQQLHKGIFTAELFNYYDQFKTNYLGNYKATERLWKNESLIFASYNYPISKKISLQTRLGLDWYQYQLTNKSKFSTWNPRANLKLTTQLSKGMLLWSFMLANSNYNMDVINNATMQINPYLQRRGNPDLHKSYDIDTYLYYSLPIRKVNVTAMMQYQFTKNPVMYDYLQTDSNIIQTFSNDHSQNHTFKTVIGATYKPSTNLAFTGDIRYTYTKLNNQQKYSLNNFTGNIGVQWYIKNIAIMPRINFGSTTLNKYTLAKIKTPINYNLKVSYSHKNLIASATAYAPFKKRSFNTALDSKYHTFNTEIINHQNYQYYTISLSYLFEFGRKVKRVDSNIDTTINSSILRDSSLIF